MGETGSDLGAEIWAPTNWLRIEWLVARLLKSRQKEGYGDLGERLGQRLLDASDDCRGGYKMRCKDVKTDLTALEMR